jgi:hypothetical protein
MIRSLATERSIDEPEKSAVNAEIAPDSGKFCITFLQAQFEGDLNSVN